MSLLEIFLIKDWVTSKVSFGSLVFASISSIKTGFPSLAGVIYKENMRTEACQSSQSTKTDQEIASLVVTLDAKTPVW